MKARLHPGAVLPLAAAFACLAALPARAADPIRIGVIAEDASIAGAAIPTPPSSPPRRSTPRAASTAACWRSSTTTTKAPPPIRCARSSRAAQQDHVAGVIVSYISEVVLALEPWAGRLKMPMITPGAASDLITQHVHDDYDHLKYVFHGYLASTQLAGMVCDAAKDLLVGPTR